jgi:ribose-phosphate pyrophosphokinase
MISTGGTIINAIKLLRDKGAKDIYITCSLPFFNGKAKELLSKEYAEGRLSKVISTDAVIHGEEFLKNNPWFDEVSIAPLFANVIHHINSKQSVSELLR